MLDTNPHAWALLASTLPLSKAVANIIVFINAHLAFNAANQVAVIASHAHRAVWLYPRPVQSSTMGDDVVMGNGNGGKQTSVSNNANKYRPFVLIEEDILTSLREIIFTTTEHDISSTFSTQMAGALTLALSYINKATINYSDAGSSANTKPSSDAIDPSTQDVPGGLQSRIFVLSVSGDLAHQYIPIMNTTFAAQRLRIPIDILKLAGDTVFLQQASDATKGIYMQPRSPQGLLQYLMTAFLPDQRARAHLVAPTQEVVDFRAACFCHRDVVDVGFVCSICLSSMYDLVSLEYFTGPNNICAVFCSPPEGATCLTCGTHLALGDYGAKPAVYPRKKKRKKRINGIETESAKGTPAPEE